jgi:hypothetical protein
VFVTIVTFDISRPLSILACSLYRFDDRQEQPYSTDINPFDQHIQYLEPHQSATLCPEHINMDPAVLRERIQATLTPDANIRRQAEIDLKRVGGSRYLWRLS